MARRRELKGIVRNLAHKLNGRNNDHLGYWAIGQLCSLAEQDKVSFITIDLSEVESNSNHESVKPFAISMHKSLHQMLTAHQIPFSWLKSAYVTFSFNEPYQKQYHYWRSALGTPYILKLEITSDLGKVYNQTFGGNVNPHDPRREKRRARF